MTLFEITVALRASGTIGDDAFHVVEEELEAFELYSERRILRLRDSLQARPPGPQ
jgi:hypothetical protein